MTNNVYLPAHKILKSPQKWQKKGRRIEAEREDGETWLQGGNKRKH